MSYFNTTSETGSTLRQSLAKAQGQDERILEFFKCHPDTLYTPDEVLEAIFTSHTPITSVRRSLNTLVNGLFLTKTKTFKQGRYGKRTHCWQLRKTGTNQLTLL